MPSAPSCQEKSISPRAQDGSRALPQGWRWVRLGEVCKVVGGSTPDSANPDFWDGEVVWVTPTDLGKNHAMVIKSSSRKITALGYESCSTEMLPTGTVIMSSRAPIGHLAIAGVPLSTNQGCKSFIPGPSVFSQFLYWMLKWDLPALRQLGSGATFAEVSKSQLEQVRVVLPPLPEQKRIAALLNEQLSTVERARVAVQEQLDDAKALPAAFLRQAFPRPGEELPPAWKWVCLGEILFRRAEVLHPGDGTQGEATFVGLEHVESGTGVRVGCETVDVASLTGRKPRFYRGDIVYGYLRPYLNKVWVANFDGLCSVDQYAFRVDTSLASAQFLSAFMRSPYYLRVAPVSTTPGQLPRIRSDEIAVVRVPLPPLPQQNRIGAILNEQIEAAVGLRKGLEAQLAEIEALPAALLRKAFSGGL